MGRFSERAKQITSLSPIMQGKERIKQDDVIARYPNCITITGCDILNTKDKKGNPITYPVITFAEDEGVFFFGGAILGNIVQSWFELANNDVDTVNAELAAEPVKVRLEKGHTKDGNNITLVTVLD